MKLTIESIDIIDVKSDFQTRVKDATLYIRLEELRQHILKDPRIASVTCRLYIPAIASGLLT